MAIYKKGYYDLYMYQGDSGNITLKGIPTTGNFLIFFEIYDENGEKFFEKRDIPSEYRCHVDISISADESDAFPVGTNYYAVKLCLYNGTEETVIPPLKNTSMSPRNFKNKALFIVYPKQIEGIEGD